MLIDDQLSWIAKHSIVCIASSFSWLGNDRKETATTIYIRQDRPFGIYVFVYHLTSCLMKRPFLARGMVGLGHGLNPLERLISHAGQLPPQETNARLPFL